MENEDDEEIARKLKRMDERTAQRRKHSSSSSDEDDGEEVALDNRWKQAKLDHKSSQDFSQDLSDEEEALAPAPVAAALTTIDYRPVPFRSAAEQAAIAADWARYHARPIPPPLEAPDYQIDPFSPWAPGGFMNFLIRPTTNYHHFFGSQLTHLHCRRELHLPQCCRELHLPQ
jgi:hypothetical protein